MPVSMAPLQKEIYRSILSMFSPVMKVTKSADLPTGVRVWTCGFELRGGMVEEKDKMWPVGA